MTEADCRFVLRVLQITSPDNCDDIWWRTDGEYAPVTFLVNCNDLFYWACADCERVTPENVEQLAQAYRDCKEATGYDLHGASLFCARVRGERPQHACYPKADCLYTQEAAECLWDLYDACGPERESGFGNPHKHPRKV
jgi:hypothetical protein